MIRTVADLLTKLLEVERERLDAMKLPHAPTIGGMYEGLSRKLLDKALPVEGLRVVPGFIQDPAGNWSKQLDCLVVKGEGKEIPYQEARIFPLDDVIAVIEVKKNLYTAELEDGFKNLRSVLKLDHVQPPKVAAAVRQAFQIIGRVPLPPDPSTLSLLHQGIYWSLVTEIGWPARVILGYHGYASTTSFRQGIIDHLQSLEKVSGWNPATLPTCIIGPKYAAAKGVAMPWGHPVIDGWWPLLTTTDRVSPVGILLEVIWSRLNFLGLLSADWFGEDLEIEAWDRLIDARPESKEHWQLNAWPAHSPDGTPEPDVSGWSPFFVEQPAFVLANMLCTRFPEPLDLTTLSGAEIDQGVNDLEAIGVAGREAGAPNRLHLLTEGLSGVILPDGRFALGENNSGRLSRWVDNFMAAWKATTAGPGDAREGV